MRRLLQHARCATSSYTHTHHDVNHPKFYGESSLPKQSFLSQEITRLQNCTSTYSFPRFRLMNHSSVILVISSGSSQTDDSASIVNSRWSWEHDFISRTTMGTRPARLNFSLPCSALSHFGVCVLTFFRRSVALSC